MAGYYLFTVNLRNPGTFAFLICLFRVRVFLYFHGLPTRDLLLTLSIPFFIYD